MGPHTSNSQSLISRQYKAVTSLKNINEISDVIDIDYDNLDSKSAGELKDTITNALRSYIDLDITPEVKSYIKKLQKMNATNKIIIDYSKIDDVQLMLAYTFKTTIQNVLAKRQKEIYSSMILNTNY